MGKNKDSLGDRMKVYENISRNYLTRRIPVIIRLDGKAFHTFTRGMRKPFDSVLARTMQETMKYLCENIQGCVLGYTQSDEITLILTDYATVTTDAWFGYNVQKMTSVSASMATLAFNKFFRNNVDKWGYENLPDYSDGGSDQDIAPDLLQQASIYFSRCDSAMFDARVFSIPKDEVCNCLVWRQQDATRNSIEAVGQAYFSHTQLYQKTCNMIQEMLWSEKNINWNEFPTMYKRGSCCYRVQQETTIPDPMNKDTTIEVVRRNWFIDVDPPIFTQEREYIERLL